MSTQKTKYKYRITTYVCPVCGDGGQSRERVPEDTLDEDLRVFVSDYCGCMDPEFY